MSVGEMLLAARTPPPPALQDQTSTSKRASTKYQTDTIRARSPESRSRSDATLAGLPLTLGGDRRLEGQLALVRISRIFELLASDAPDARSGLSAPLLFQYSGLHVVGDVYRLAAADVTRLTALYRNPPSQLISSCICVSLLTSMTPRPKTESRSPSTKNPCWMENRSLNRRYLRELFVAGNSRKKKAATSSSIRRIGLASRCSRPNGRAAESRCVKL